MEIKIDEDRFYEYAVEKREKTINGKQVSEEVVVIIKEANKITEKISSSNADSFLNTNQELLTKERLEQILSRKFTSLFLIYLPKIQFWKPASEFLINTQTSLSEFKENPEISIPLKNIFHIAGYATKDEIKSAIEKVLGKQERVDELKDKLSNAITRHLNRVWSEHKIRLKISINEDSCEVHVEDKDKNYNYYQMEQRSDGFKQFVSLILTLSALNESKKLSNTIILIDEPEVHLHPSGVRDMRNEILKIGKNNFVFAATHSHYMVDTIVPERHWIVRKEKSETSIKQISDDTPIEDDTVLSSAFGLNLFKELIPKNIIIVEGNDDKQIISMAIKLLASKFFYSIKSANGASKAPTIASLLNEERVPAFILFDDDKEGRDNKKRILDNIKESFNIKNVFTIRDLDDSLPLHATIEDLLPLSFVKEFFEKEMVSNFHLDNEQARILQFKNQSNILKENKAKLDSVKLKLARSFCDTYNDREALELNAPRLTKLIKLLITQIENEN